MPSELNCITQSAEVRAVFYFNSSSLFSLVHVDVDSQFKVYFMQMQFEQGIYCGMLIYGSQIVDTLVYTTQFHPCVHRFWYSCLPVKELYNVAADSQPRPESCWTNIVRSRSRVQQVFFIWYPNLINYTVHKISSFYTFNEWGQPSNGLKEPSNTIVKIVAVVEDVSIFLLTNSLKNHLNTEQLKIKHCYLWAG